MASRVGGIRPIRGADLILDQLQRNGWAVALATGAWRRASTLKLDAGGVRYDGLPFATSEDGPARIDIVTSARLRAEQLHGVGKFSRVVSIGDGIWDVDAARALGIPFLGLAVGERRSRLEARGTSGVLEDFSDVPATIAALGRARVPSRT